MHMRERKKINKSHPDFPAYYAKCEALWAEYKPQIEAIEKAGRAAQPDWRGNGSPWAGGERAVMKKYHAALKQLQKEYADLFEQAPDDEA